MTERYRHGYAEYTVYANLVGLVAKWRRAGGEVVVDLGCGYGPVAEPVRDLGVAYIGCDLELAGLRDLERRGFETEQVDLADVEDTVSALEKKLAGRSLAGIVLLDTLEHLTNGPELLGGLSELAAGRGGAPLFLGVPNVTHQDLVGKLLLGRWEMTPEGLLDDTHVSFFSPGRLLEVMAGAGWVPIDQADYVLSRSDQHFPADAATLVPGAPLHDLLFQVRDQAAEAAVVNEFVRVYAPVSAAGGHAGDEAEGPAPFLSVLVRTQGRRQATLEETLLSLAAQTSQDFEVLILAHDVARETLGDLRYLADCFAGSFPERVRVIPVDGGGRSRPLNVGVEQARGRYVAILDDDDIAFGHWVETFERAAQKFPGQVLRSVPAEQDVEPTTWVDGRPGYGIAGRPRCRWPVAFDLLEHLVENHSPPCGYALPRSAFVDLGIRFDESLPVLEDWDVLMRVGTWCGVADTGEVTALWRRWRTGDSSTSVHAQSEWNQARSAVIAKLDTHPLVLPARSVTAVHDLAYRAQGARAEADRLRGELEAICRERDAHQEAAGQTQRELAEMRSSTSWKLAKPVRVAGRLARRIVGG